MTLPVFFVADEMDLFSFMIEIGPGNGRRCEEAVRSLLDANCWLSDCSLPAGKSKQRPEFPAWVWEGIGGAESGMPCSSPNVNGELGTGPNWGVNIGELRNDGGGGADKPEVEEEPGADGNS